MICHQTYEYGWRGDAPEGNAAQIPAWAEWTAPSGKTIAVKAFYAGDGSYRMRLLPEEKGEYRCVLHGMDDAPAPFTLTASASANKHGRVVAEDCHFRYADGSRYVPFGTTVYALAHQPDALVDETLATLAASPFNKVRMCVFPKHYEYNHNEPPCYPFEKGEDGRWDVKRPCFVFWERFERILDRLESAGVEVDLILFHPYDRWGFDSLSPEENLIYLDYLLRRFAARPNIWWSMANEYDFCATKTMADWAAIEQFIADNDPFHHLLSCHNCFQPYDATRANITHASLQRKVISYMTEWRETYRKPILIDECGYEGNLPEAFGCFSGQEMTARFYRGYFTGGFVTHGETFLDKTGNEIVWWAKGGRLIGESVPRIAFLREVMAEIPGQVDPVPDHMAAALDPSKKPMLAATVSRLPKELMPIVNALLATSPKELEQVLLGDMDYKGQCGRDDAFLWYFDQHGYSSYVLELPESAAYRVTVIDTWAMTKETAAENAGGRVRIALPAKTGMAVIAVKVS